LSKVQKSNPNNSSAINETGQEYSNIIWEK